MLRQVLSTIAYSDQFRFPLTAVEIEQRLLTPLAVKKLISNQSKNDKAFKTLAQALIFLTKNKTVYRSGKWYGLGSKAHLKSVITCRERRAQNLSKIEAETQHFCQLVGRWPWVKAVFVTGSAAMNNADLDDDLDLMIITDPKRLWITRLVITTQVWLAGKKRGTRTDGKHGWCLNFWLDTEHLQVPTAKQSVYQAYEVIQAKPVFDRQQTVSLFYQQNQWVKKYLQNYPLSTGQHFQKTIRRSSFATLIDAIDFLTWNIQVVYMNSHRTSEQVGRGFAFFHPRNTQQLIFQRWHATLAESLAKLPLTSNRSPHV